MFKNEEESVHGTQSGLQWGARPAWRGPERAPSRPPCVWCGGPWSSRLSHFHCTAHSPDQRPPRPTGDPHSSVAWSWTFLGGSSSGISHLRLQLSGALHSSPNTPATQWTLCLPLRSVLRALLCKAFFNSPTPELITPTLCSLRTAQLNFSCRAPPAPQLRIIYWKSCVLPSCSQR